MQDSIFHPLTTLHKEKTCCHKNKEEACCFTGYSTLVKKDDVLYAYNCQTLRCACVSKLTSWTVLPLPVVEHFALTTYQSQLVLVGGLRLREVLNEIWVSDNDGRSWKRSLPPMPTCRQRASAANTGNPEYVIVVGGDGSNDEALASMDILVHGQWASTQALPISPWLYHDTIHNGNLYIRNDKCAYYCKVAACVQTHRAEGEKAPWKEADVPPSTTTLFSLGGTLLAFSGGGPYQWPKLRAYSPSTQSWVCVGEVASQYCICSALAVAPGRIVLSGNTILTATLQGMPKPVYYNVLAI